MRADIPMTETELVNLRHALRTPLNHIIGYAEILRDDNQPDASPAALAALDEILLAARRILDQLQTLTGGVSDDVDFVAGLRTAIAAPLAAIRAAIPVLEPLRDSGGQDIVRIETAVRTLERFARSGQIEDAAPIAMPSLPAEPAPWIGARVLVVDDDEANRTILQRMLEKEGFTVECAKGGEEALKVLEDFAFDLVLLDLVMPGLDGYDVLAAMRKSPALRSVPVIVLSASDELSHIVRSIDMGAEDFVSKPFDPVLLRVRMSASLRRKRAEEEAARHAEGFRLLLESSGDGIYGVDTAGRCTFINRAACELLGYRQADLIGRNLHTLLHHTHADGSPYSSNDCPVHEVMRSGQPQRVTEELLFRSDGSTIPVQYSAHPIVKDGQVQGGVVTFTDISDRKRNEDRVREAAKLESLGVLAGGIAHDFNNLLTGIMGNASLALETMASSDSNIPLLEEIVRASERAADLTRQMLAYAGKGRYLSRPLDLSALVREMTDLLKASLPKKVQFDLDLASSLPAVEADQQQMQQLLLNLVINAGEAIGNRAGRVAVRTRTTTVTAGTAAEPGFAPLAPGAFVSIVVEDTGSGIDAATRARIFDPFFTTKFTGRGLGLPASMGIVRSHGGAMRVETEPGKGSRFEVLLPAVKAHVASS